MKVAGVLCEYNPLHLGHAAMFRKIRAALGEDTALVCVMSGNFVQRGEPAVFHKSVRAQAAVTCGADLVLELPVTGALSSAEGFARAGVDILTRLGVVDHLCFGSESGDLGPLLRAAAAVDGAEFAAALRLGLDAGKSYGAARQQALELLTGVPGVARTPNDILAVEYCRALREQNSPITPVAVFRPGNYHDSVPDGENPSATALRACMEDGSYLQYVPREVRELFAGAARYALPWGERAVLARLRAMTEEEWARTAHGSEGLWSKAMKASRRETTLFAVAEATRSRRYPMSRISRLLLCAYLGLTAEDLQRPPAYGRILAFSATGRQLLRRAREEGSLPLLNAGEPPADGSLWEQERRCADLYALFARELPAAAPGSEQAARIHFSEK